MLGSFQCRGDLLLLHIVGQGPAMLAAGAGWVGYIFYIFHLSSISNVLCFGTSRVASLQVGGTCSLHIWLGDSAG